MQVLLAAALGAWLVALVAQVTGSSESLHHDALIEGGLPMAVTVPMFVVGWQVMTAAMMLPASIPALKGLGPRLRPHGRRSFALVAFLGAFFAAWTLFGLIALAGDVTLHRIVEDTPWLAARPWLVEASALALAGAYQFTPLKHRGLAACRHPADSPVGVASTDLGARLGLAHALECFASSGALMLLMFAVGVGNLLWMAALAAVMAYEAMGRHGPRAASAVGILFVGLACLVVLSDGTISLVGVR